MHGHALASLFNAVNTMVIIMVRLVLLGHGGARLVILHRAIMPGVVLEADATL